MIKNIGLDGDSAYFSAIFSNLAPLCENKVIFAHFKRTQAPLPILIISSDIFRLKVIIPFIF